MQNELYHYGIKGMRWGVRKNKFRSSDKYSRKIIKSERKKAMKNRRNLSDNELRKRVDRFKLEKEFKSLSESDLHPGRSIVKDIISFSGKKVAKTVLTGATIYGIKSALSKEFNLKEFAGYVAPKPKKQ